MKKTFLHVFFLTVVCSMNLACDNQAIEHQMSNDKFQDEEEKNAENITFNENATIYYVSNTAGSDSYDGLSETTPLKSLQKVASVVEDSNVVILLKRGDTWINEALIFNDIEANELNPVVISSYGEGYKPVIKNSESVAAITLRNCSGFIIEDIEFEDNINHIELLYPYRNGREFKRIRNCNFSGGGAAIKFHGDYQINEQTGYEYNIKDVVIENCYAENVYSFVFHPVFENVIQVDFTTYCIHDLYIKDCNVKTTSSYGTSIRFTKGGYIDNCTFVDLFTDPAQNGSCGILLRRTDHFDIKNTEVGYVHRSLFESPDGEAIDFEGHCVDCTVSNCYLHHCAGPGMMIFYTAGSNGPIKYNRRCNIINNTFHLNNQSAYHPSHCEIWITDPMRDPTNIPSIIAGNKFTWVPGIQFYLIRKNIDTNILFNNNTVVYESEMFEWNFNNSTAGIPAEGSHNCISSINKMEHAVHLRINPASQEGVPYFAFYDKHFQDLDVGLNIDAQENRTITFIFKNETPATKLRLEWDQDIAGSYPEANHVTVDLTPNSSEYKMFTFNLSDVSTWTGTIKKFRLVWPDYLSGRGDFYIDYFRIWDDESVINGL